MLPQKCQPYSLSIGVAAASDIGEEVLEQVSHVSVHQKGACADNPEKECEASYDMSYDPPVS